MTYQETELNNLKEAILEMMSLVRSQLEKAKLAFLGNDSELAEEIIHNEKRINAMELSIDRDCENILALFNPVATDLRFVISMLKINSDLERIGDHTEGIASYVVELEKPYPAKILEATQMIEMFDIAISMMADIQTAFEEGDTQLARKVYKKDKDLNKINRKTSRVITELTKENPENIRSQLFLFSTSRKLERVGDHIKNIAEDIIFHLEAKVLKHKKKK